MSFELVGIQEQLQALLMKQQAITKMEPSQEQQKIQALHEVQQDVITSQHQSHDTFEPKFIQEMVDLLGTTDEYAKVIVNGVEYIPSKRSHVELPESQCYAYIHTPAGLFCFDIPLAKNHDVKLKTIFHNPANPLPYHMGLFSHHHKLYMVGGNVEYTPVYNSHVYVFDPNMHPKLPISDPCHLYKPKELYGSFKRMVNPYVIQSRDQIYFLSFKNFFRSRPALDFQSFDMTKNHFKTLKSPPCQGGGNVTGFFSLYDYIYLFITGMVDCPLAYIFDTQSSEWKEHILDEFDEREIPIPGHIGDVGLSDAGPDKSRILITLNHQEPTAYCIKFHDDGSLSPISCRCLDEIFIHREYKCEDEYARLLDVGQGRFCVVYRSYRMPLLIYVFQIDYEAERHTQFSMVKQSSPSSRILSAKRFRAYIPVLGASTITALSLASTKSNEGKDVEKENASKSNEGKDVEKENESKSCRSNKRGGKTSNKRGGKTSNKRN